ncbi:imidazole glycerol phosphate synthase HisHF [Desulfovermiculus halophilus]|uniref:imidazole glycerol phosphate synthase HisHF n=1 Tax=Desulfovermiculus halophilus TaxID=339722 RepID=UPI000487096A|nr:imidazole glycerol phosphate synthase HisHF [Desulfovermiculus halophilus]
MITLLDYGAGNVRSVINALEHLGESIRLVHRPEDILHAETLVFPGVGAFGSMMRILQDKGLVAPLRSYLRANRPFLGICLGLQALFEGSEEAPGIPGLGIFSGQVQHFRTGLSVPHIGWNQIRAHKDSGLLHGLKGHEHLYFVHSYHVVPDDPGLALTTTDYGQSFVSAVQQGNICATQFHPEKSGPVGLQILKNFLQNKPPTRPRTELTSTSLAKRIVACLDVRSNDQGDLVVTKGDQYDVREKGEVRNLGKPVDLAQEYYQQGADEITFLNITAFRDYPLSDVPMLEVLRRTSANVFVPLTIGGGIRDYTDVNGTYHSAVDVAAAYFRSGADKISIGSDAVDIVQNSLRFGPCGQSSIESIARVYGNQAVVISVDPRRVYVHSPAETNHQVIETAFPGPQGQRHCWYQCTVKGGREGRDLDAVTLARECQRLGAGEILLNCIDRDGTNLGFDLELIRAVRQAVTIPVIASSGAGAAQHFVDVFTRTEAEAALAAGIFHRREVPIAEVKKALAGHVPVRLHDPACAA